MILAWEEIDSLKKRLAGMRVDVYAVAKNGIAAGDHRNRLDSEHDNGILAIGGDSPDCESIS